MKKIKKLIVVVTALGVLGTAGTVYAATLKTPSEIASEVTGKSVDTVIEERATTGKTYGTIAKEAGKLDEFNTQMLEQRKAVLDEQVKEKAITQQQADDIYNAIKNNQALYGTNGRGYGMRGYGQGQGYGCGGGLGNGYGCGLGSGRGSSQGTAQGTSLK
ncbi:hypothetical protein [Desulfitobacterium sp.]|uniref:hypothetical protein n=1 Tax=Desulfitobacterium sp. TaxID=49981 RepID=UPI002BD3C62B|nr:hypothetical protein [Desulfitobacterium sp.]HVJ49341.1 hypothetical protein [Desulfitobacterium sp.]